MKLAENGVNFTNSYTCQPVCGPARACLQTGLYATQNQCYWNGIPLPQNIKPLAEYFNEAGYETAYVGKWHLASDRLPNVGFHCEKAQFRRTCAAVIKIGGVHPMYLSLHHTDMMDMSLTMKTEKLISRATALIV